MDTVSFTDGIAKEYVNFRKLIKRQSVSDRDPFLFRFLILKRVTSMLGLTLLLNWAAPHLIVDDFLGGWSLSRIMLLTILIEGILVAYDAIWAVMMSMVHRLLNIVDYITRFPPIDFPEDKEDVF